MAAGDDSCLGKPCSGLSAWEQQATDHVFLWGNVVQPEETRRSSYQTTDEENGTAKEKRGKGGIK